MRFSRRIGLAVLAAFAVKAAVPAPILVTHRHEGGCHEHVHGEARPWHPHGDGDPHEHGDDHDHGGPASSGSGIHPAAVDGQHTHWQLPFQRLAAATSAPIAGLHALGRVVLPAPGDPPTANAPTARSRGPPPSSRR